MCLGTSEVLMAQRLARPGDGAGGLGPPTPVKRPGPLQARELAPHLPGAPLRPPCLACPGYSVGRPLFHLPSFPPSGQILH